MARKFKPGDRIILKCPSGYYGTTQNGWTGRVLEFGSSTVYILWDKLDEAMSVEVEHVFLIDSSDRIAYNAKNKPAVAEGESNVIFYK